jgi:hypothetical protein
VSISIKYEKEGEKTISTLIYAGETYKFKHYSLEEAHRYVNNFIKNAKMLEEDNVQIVKINYNLYKESDYGTLNPNNELVLKIVHDKLTGEFKHVKTFYNGKEMK